MPQNDDQTPKPEDAADIPETEWAMSAEDIEEIFLSSCSPDIRAMFETPRPERPDDQPTNPTDTEPTDAEIDGYTGERRSPGSLGA